MTKTEQKIVDKMNTEPYRIWYPLAFVSTIYSAETINKYSHNGRSMRVIDHMTCLYLGRMARKGILRWSSRSLMYDRGGYSLEGNYAIYKNK
jgi:hypothetical protein